MFSEISAKMLSNFPLHSCQNRFVRCKMLTRPGCVNLEMSHTLQRGHVQLLSWHASWPVLYSVSGNGHDSWPVLYSVSGNGHDWRVGTRWLLAVLLCYSETYRNILILYFPCEGPSVGRNHVPKNLLPVQCGNISLPIMPSILWMARSPKYSTMSRCSTWACWQVMKLIDLIDQF